MTQIGKHVNSAADLVGHRHRLADQQRRQSGSKEVRQGEPAGARQQLVVGTIMSKAQKK